MLMKYKWIGISENGSQSEGETIQNVSCETEGIDLIDKWNREGARGGYPKWKYELLGFENGYVLTSSAQLVLDCWSPFRHQSLCWKCPRVERCKLDEAWYGRLELLRQKVLRLEQKYHTALWKFLTMADKRKRS